ncbi:MAG: hypothetical protein HY422_00130 [Candidatus Komeilibacteria bacterium]|nr:hypothetical protein [Candidatus Komeilibacteria bacterium]
MAKLPEIDGLELNRMKGQIRLTARDQNGELWYIHERGLDPRNTIFTRRPMFRKPAHDLELLFKIPIYLPLLPGNRDVEATVSEVFAQLIQPIHPDGIEAPRFLRRIEAIEVVANEHKIDQNLNAMIAYINVYQRAR